MAVSSQLISFFFFLRWHLIYSWQYPGRRCGFKTENAQFLSDLWMAPAFRSLSQETALDGLSDCAAGGAQVEPGARGDRSSCHFTGQGCLRCVAPAPPSLGSWNRTWCSSNHWPGVCLQLGTVAFFYIKSAILWVTCISCGPLRFSPGLWGSPWDPAEGGPGCRGDLPGESQPKPESICSHRHFLSFWLKECQSLGFSDSKDMLLSFFN